MSPLCRIGLHSWPRYVNPMTQAPAPIRCQRGCGKRYGEHKTERTNR